MSDAPPAATLPAPGPFLKWAGGKTGLLAQLRPFFPPAGQYQRYVEPFLGGGAVFFALRQVGERPPAARLADVNADLIGTWTVVRDRVEELIEALRHHRNDRDHFNEMRELDPSELDPITAAARFVYLNRTCYNGLYRVNRAGKFNVPFGSYHNPRICQADTLRAASLALRDVELVVGDFEDTTADLGRGDFVYFDPPYVPTSATANFTDYAEDGFNHADQRRLADLFHDLDDRGCTLLLSNSYHELVRKLYKRPDDERHFPLREVTARRAISCDANTRGPVLEYVVANYPLAATRSR
jgi:DNA adenine methylase